MNLRRKAPADSLYLLLDTLCNAFGGIILLAVLVVLLTSKEKSRNPAAAGSAEMVQRRLAIAQTNLQASLQLAAALETKAGSGELQQQLALLSTRKDLEDAIEQTREAVVQKRQDLDSASAADPVERLKTLNLRLAEAQARKADVQNQLEAEQAEIERLKHRAPDLERQVVVKIQETERTLRLPKEHETGKRVAYVIVRYGRVYPVYNPDLSRNENDIQWLTLFHGDSAVPIPAKGYDPLDMAPYFASLSPKDVYFVFCAYYDSFPAFIRARELAVANGYSCGWEPFAPRDPVIFSPLGHVPKPQ